MDDALRGGGRDGWENVHSSTIVTTSGTTGILDPCRGSCVIGRGWHKRGLSLLMAKSRISAGTSRGKMGFFGVLKVLSRFCIILACNPWDEVLAEGARSFSRMNWCIMVLSFVWLFPRFLSARVSRLPWLLVEGRRMKMRLRAEWQLQRRVLAFFFFGRLGGAFKRGSYCVCVVQVWEGWTVSFSAIDAMTNLRTNDKGD